ncbi:LacI family DNA-binding transcriptional regulator [Evansella sp. AB-rgal1]|uniref:LacI family DNA-binding transcriptional regulator n=1 Tax=Evansella sp. AB-rgal1 TaxID=3242696 RepID=UPI00359D3BCA
MGVTIKDVAKEANVAPSTVSRVIADHPSISIETKQRVREIMKRLGYHPNFQARSLSSKSAQTIGIVMPDSTDRVFQNPFFPEVIRGIGSVAHGREYGLFISTGETEEEIFEGVQRMVYGRRVDGFVLLYSRVQDKVTNFLRKQGFPFVIVGKPNFHMDEISHVDNDNVKAARDATNYLIQNGHERISFIGGSRELLVTVDRLEGYRQALEEANIPFQEEYIITEKALKEGGEEAAAELAKLPKKPTATIVTDDLMSFGLMNALYGSHIKVPEDLSIISFNNVLLAEMSHPPLTSVDVQVFQLGYQAGKCLIEKIKEPNEPNKRIIVPHNIVERKSIITIEKQQEEERKNR